MVMQRIAHFGGLLLGLSSFSAGAALDISPFATLGWTYDDNILKTANAAEAIELNGSDRQADSELRLLAGVNVELDYRGQKLYALANIDHSKFSFFDALDHTGVEFESGLRWLALRRLGGQMTLTVERDLETFDNKDSSQPGEVREIDFETDVFWQLSERWHWTNLLAYSTRSSDLLDSQDFDEDRLTLETKLEYVRSPVLTLGGRFQWDDGEFPNRNDQNIADGFAKNFTETRLLFTVNWRPSVVSSFFGELGVVDRRNEGLSERDLTDITSQLNYTRFFSRRTSAELRLYRRIEPAEEQDSNFVQRTGFEADYIWNYSHKWRFKTNLRLQESSFESSPGLNVQGEARKDNDVRLSIESTYAFTPILTLTPELGWERDRSNDADKEHDSFAISLTLRLGY